MPSFQTITSKHRTTATILHMNILTQNITCINTNGVVSIIVSEQLTNDLINYIKKHNKIQIAGVQIYIKGSEHIFSSHQINLLQIDPAWKLKKLLTQQIRNFLKVELRYDDITEVPDNKGMKYTFYIPQLNMARHGRSYPPPQGLR